MKGKLKWIIIGIVLILAISIISIIIVNEMQTQYSVEEIKDYNYFILDSNGKYGVVDKSGNVIIEPEYAIVQIPNPSKDVFICLTQEEQSKYTTTVYNKQKKVLFEEYKNVQAIPIDINIDKSPYEKSTLIYEKDGKYGLINFKGKEIAKPIYDSISSINYKEGSFLVKQGDKVGIINMKGKEIIPIEYETITSDNYYSETTKNKTTGFIVSKKTEDGYRYGYIDYKGNTVLKTEYTQLERVTEIQDEKNIYFIAFKDGQAGLLKNQDTILNYEYEDIQYNNLNNTFIVQRNRKEGAVTIEGQTILHPEYDTILFAGIYLNAIKGNSTLIFDLQGNQIQTDIISMNKTENPKYFIAIDKSNNYTVVDSNRNVLIDNNYNYIEYLAEDYFIVARDGKNGVIDITGKSVLELKYDSIFKINNTNLLQAEMSENNMIELYNSEIKKVAAMEKAMVKDYASSNNTNKKYIVLTSETELSYYDENGNKLEAKEIFTDNKLFAKKINDKWGFIDVNSNLAIQNEYEMVTDFNEYGFAGIKKDGKWGVINQEGTIVQEPIYNIEWFQPSFIGKYYKINAWYGDSRYSDDIL